MRLETFSDARLRIRLATCLAIVALQGCPKSVPAQTLPTGFSIEPVALGPFGTAPAGFALLPDGRAILVEKDDGVVRLTHVGSTVSVAIDTIPDVAPTYEEGLVGVAVDPDWPDRPYLYFDTNQGFGVIAIYMYTAVGDLEDPGSTNLQITNRYTILTIPDQQGIHQAGTLRFGTDGYLYVSIGEDGQACLAQNKTDLRGKILRLDVGALPGPGSGPPDKAIITPPSNPFVTSPNENERLLWCYGLRNPFRFNIDPQTNDLVLGDVGWNTWEEIDFVRFSSQAGTNYGWPEFEGPLQDPVPGSESCSTGPFVAPIYTYVHEQGASSVVCGPVYRSNHASAAAFPPDYDGDVFFCEFYAGWVRRLEFNGATWRLARPVDGQSDVLNWGRIPFITDMQMGPDGSIYFLTMVDTPVLGYGLHRIVHRGIVDSDLRHDSAAIRSVPNPAHARSGVEIRLGPVRRQASTVRIYDPAGRLVRELSATAANTVRWDGRSELGGYVAPGVYLYRIVMPGGREAQGKISFVR